MTRFSKSNSTPSVIKQEAKCIDDHKKNWNIENKKYFGHSNKAPQGEWDIPNWWSRVQNLNWDRVLPIAEDNLLIRTITISEWDPLWPW